MRIYCFGINVIFTSVSISSGVVLPGTFLGYALIAGGISKGDILVADIEELEKLDAS